MADRRTLLNDIQNEVLPVVYNAADLVNQNVVNPVVNQVTPAINYLTGTSIDQLPTDRNFGKRMQNAIYPPTGGFQTDFMKEQYTKAREAGNLAEGGLLNYTPKNARYTESAVPINVSRRNPQALQQGALLGPIKETLPPGVAAGNDQGNANRSKEEQLGFMDKIFGNPMLQRMMERSLYSQPTFGGNFISEQASGERGLRSMEAQSAELAQKKAMENNKIQATLRAAELKAGKGVKPDGTLATLTRSYYKSSQGVDLLTQMKNLTTEGAAGGPLAVSENALNAILTSFGGNPEESTAAKLGVLRAQLMDSFTFTGKDISEADKKIIDELLPPTGGLTLSKKQFTFALNKLLAKLSNEKTFSGNSIRTDYGRNPDQYIRREAKPKLTVTGSRQVPK